MALYVASSELRMLTTTFHSGKKQKQLLQLTAEKVTHSYVFITPGTAKKKHAQSECEGAHKHGSCKCI